MVRGSMLAGLLGVIASHCGAGSGGTGGTGVTTAPLPARTVTVYGDSLVAATQPALEAVYSAAGWQAGVAAIPGSHLADWATDIADGDLADVTVIALDTNDARDTPADVWAAQVADTLWSIPDGRCVVWVGMYESAVSTPVEWLPRAYNDGARTLNTVTQHAVVARPNTVWVSWEAVAVGHRDWFTADGVHMTAIGKGAYLQLLVDAATTSCA